jgi:hypothetical protein
MTFATSSETDFVFEMVSEDLAAESFVNGGTVEYQV